MEPVPLRDVFEEAFQFAVRVYFMTILTISAFYLLLQFAYLMALGKHALEYIKN
jgi:hypothetical protein